FDAIRLTGWTTESQDYCAVCGILSPVAQQRYRDCRRVIGRNGSSIFDENLKLNVRSNHVTTNIGWVYDRVGFPTARIEQRYQYGLRAFLPQVRYRKHCDVCGPDVCRKNARGGHGVIVHAVRGRPGKGYRIEHGLIRGTEYAVNPKVSRICYPTR